MKFLIVEQVVKKLVTKLKLIERDVWLSNNYSPALIDDDDWFSQKFEVCNKEKFRSFFMLIGKREYVETYDVLIVLKKPENFGIKHKDVFGEYYLRRYIMNNIKVLESPDVEKIREFNYETQKYQLANFFKGQKKVKPFRISELPKLPFVK